MQVRVIPGPDARGAIGSGLFARKDLPRGRVVGVYSGALIKLEGERPVLPLAGYVHRRAGKWSKVGMRGGRGRRGKGRGPGEQGGGGEGEKDEEGRRGDKGSSVGWFLFRHVWVLLK